MSHPPHTGTELDPSRAHINPLGIRSVDHIEFFVDDVEAWTDYYVNRFGLYRRACGDPSTGLADRKAHVVGQGRVNFLFVEPAGDGKGAQAIREHIEKHGNGVKDVAFRVDDARLALKRAAEAGATVLRGPEEHEIFVGGTIAAYGDTVHSLIERKKHGIFAPGYENVAGGIPGIRESKRSRSLSTPSHGRRGIPSE